MNWSTGTAGFFWGVGSAISLVIGAGIGLWLKPTKKTNGVCMSFGAGALLFALTIELFGHVPHYVAEHGTTSLVVAIIGALSGGILFDLLNHTLNNRGAFIRKIGVARQYICSLKISRKKKLIKELSKIDIMRFLPPKNMAFLVHRIKKGQYQAGETIFSQGDEPKELYFICNGEVSIVIHKKNKDSTELLANLKPGDTFGEIGVLGGFPRTADAIAKTNLQVYRIGKEDFQEIMKNCPELKSALEDLGANRISSLKSRNIKTNIVWQRETQHHLEDSTISVSMEEIQAENKAGYSGAAMAIWLGILLDSIPESLVIGLMVISSSGISLAFIVGVFLANFPEAMSSAVTMRSQGMRLINIYTMWASITFLTGIGAFIGAAFFPSEPTENLFFFIVGVEGLAGGAMLTMIAETMFPEAFEQGGFIIGLSALGGFLSALLVKILFP